MAGANADNDHLDAPKRGDEIAAAVIESGETGITPGGGQATAKRALELLTLSHGFVAPDAPARKHIAQAFAGAGKVVYGRAFDAVKVADGPDIDFADLGSVEANLSRIVLYEVKSTNRAKLGPDFAGYFFSLSTAELLVAQSLGDRFRLAFVNVAVDPPTVRERTLQQLFQQTLSIYPTWSIRLGHSPDGG
jgi:hypothetical protein